jgi:hypothetical protein
MAFYEAVEGRIPGIHGLANVAFVHSNGLTFFNRDTWLENAAKCRTVGLSLGISEARLYSRRRTFPRAA